MRKDWTWCFPSNYPSLLGSIEAPCEEATRRNNKITTINPSHFKLPFRSAHASFMTAAWANKREQLRKNKYCIKKVIGTSIRDRLSATDDHYFALSLSRPACHDAVHQRGQQVSMANFFSRASLLSSAIFGGAEKQRCCYCVCICNYHNLPINMTIITAIAITLMWTTRVENGGATSVVDLNKKHKLPETAHTSATQSVAPLLQRNATNDDRHDERAIAPRRSSAQPKKKDSLLSKISTHVCTLFRSFA